MAAELGEAFVPIRATLDKLDGDLAAAKGKIQSALGGLGDGLQKAGGLALAGAVGAATAALGALSGALGFSVGQALEAEQSQSDLALAVKNANAVIDDQAKAYADASGKVVTSTKLSADEIAGLQTKLETATAKLHDMEVAYPKLKNPTESQTLAFKRQQETVDNLTAQIAEGSQVITTNLVDALGLVPPQAGFTADSLNALAQSFMDLAGGSDDAITAIETIALRSGNISSNEMPAFIQRVLDLGQVMGDTAGAAQLLARADEDPIGAMGRLTRAGVIFSPVLKKQIADMVKAGDTAGATALLYDRVSEATGGAAAAHAATLAGQWEILKGRLGEAAEEVGTAVLPALHDLNTNVIQPLIPVVTALAVVFAGNLRQALSDLFAMLQAGESPLDAFTTFIGDFLPPDLLPRWIAFLASLDPFLTWIQTAVAAVQPWIDMAVQWAASNLKVQDVLITLGVAIASVVIPAIASVVAAAAPVVVALALVMAAVVLLRTAWENDWGGIQEKVAAVWAWLQPTLALVVAWLSVNVPIALKALSDFWVNTAWPAIQNAVAVAWPIIQQIFAALVSWVTGTLIPTVASLWLQWTTVWWPAIVSALTSAWAFIQPILAGLITWVTTKVVPAILDLYTKWTTIWWPTIQTVLQNVWTIILGVFQELDRWVNKNIIPWINELNRIWSTVVWPAIQSAVEGFWKVIQPILKDLGDWISATIPVAVKALQPVFEGAMKGISDAVSPVKDLWDKFTAAVTTFWNWISSTVFSFKISIPDLPDWAVPGSPLPIHTAWKAFAGDLARMNIAPRIDMGGVLPVQTTVEDGGGDRSIHFTSSTTVQTNQDPLRVLRASRHLDKLGALA